MISSSSSERPRPHGSPGNSRLRANDLTADFIRSLLAKHPEVRPEMLEKGRRLLADRSYPPPDVLRSVANQLLCASEWSIAGG
jgi:hypothetical protein